MKKLLFCLIVSFAIYCANAEINIYPDAGFYDESIEITIESTEGEDIFYSLDGTRENSKKYTEPIVFEKSDAYASYTVRAWSFSEKDKTNSYILGPDCESRFTMPVAVISTSDEALHDYYNGIFEKGDAWDAYDLANPNADQNNMHHPANYNRRGDEWRKDAHLYLFDENGSVLLDQDVKLSVFGAATSSFEQKSLRVDADETIDPDNPDFVTDIFDPVIPEGTFLRSISKYNSLVFRNGGNDNNRSWIRWNLMSRLLLKAGEKAVTPCTPVIVFVNGAYYGLSQLQPRLSNKFISNSTGINDTQNIEKLKDGNKVVFAEPAVADLPTKDYSTDEAIEELNETVDVDNMIRYAAIELLTNNGDWNGNLCMWRYTGENDSLIEETDGRWRFIAYDMDFCYGLQKDKEVFSIIFDSDGTVPLANMIKSMFNNQGVRDRFFANAYQLMNEVFIESEMTELVEDFNAQILDEITLLSPLEWMTSADHVKHFNKLEDGIRGRRSEIYTAFDQYLCVNEYYTLSVNSNDADVYLNGVLLSGDVSGDYPVNAGAVLTCIPHNGSKFLSWNANGEEITNEELTVTEDMRAGGSVAITVNCEKMPDTLEIYAVASKGDDDYLVIKNVGNNAFDLKGVFISDDEDFLQKQALPDITLAPEEELVIYENAFENALCFGISDGETVCLSNGADILDSLCVPKMGENQEYRKSGNAFRYYNRREID